MSDDQGPAPRPRSRLAAIRDSKILGVNADGVVLLVCVVLFVALASFGMSDSTYARIERGPLLRLSGEVAGSAVVSDGDVDGGGWFAMTTVQVRTLNWGEVILETVRGRSVSPLDATAAPRVAAQMDASKHLAAAVALDVAGYTYESQPGAYVGAVAPGSPAAAAGVLPGSVILAVDGRLVDTPQDVADRVAAVSSSPGSTVTLALAEDPLRSDVVVERAVAVADGRIGVELLVASAAGLGEVLDIPTGQIGGPSAGLMMTLAFLDAMHPGDLTAGRRVTGTGTISTSRAVGPVSGAPLKAAAARGAGMDVFFVPREHMTEVYAQRDADMLVVPVATVDDAIEALCALGATDALCAPTD